MNDTQIRMTVYRSRRPARVSGGIFSVAWRVTLIVAVFAAVFCVARVVFEK